MKDQFSGGLAVIHESESIPRPIWPTAFPNPRELYQSEENPEYDSKQIDSFFLLMSYKNSKTCCGL